MKQIDQPKVTVVTAVWNLYEQSRVEFFEEMMESVHYQTYSNIEHLIVDNNSTDGTAKLLDRYAKKGWISKIVFESKQGIWHAMNAGLAAATGEFVNFMNSDDFFCLDNAIELSISEIKKVDADWSYGGAHLVDRENTENIFWNWNVRRWRKIYNGRCPNHQTIFIRTELLRRFGGFEISDKHPYSMSDDKITMRLVFDGYIPAVLQEVIVKFRYGGASSGDGSLVNSTVYAHFVYEKFGKEWGIPEHWFEILYYDWYLDHNRFSSLIAQQITDNVDKIKIQDWRYLIKNDLKVRIENPTTTKSTSYYCIKLFGFIPLITVKKHTGKNHTIYSIFGLPLLSVKQSMHTKKYSLFLFIPIFKVKQ